MNYCSILSAFRVRRRCCSKASVRPPHAHMLHFGGFGVMCNNIFQALVCEGTSLYINQLLRQLTRTCLIHRGEQQTIRLELVEIWQRCPILPAKVFSSSSVMTFSTNPLFQSNHPTIKVSTFGLAASKFIHLHGLCASSQVST